MSDTIPFCSDRALAAQLETAQTTWREEQARQIHQWAEQQAWDLCDDIAGRGATELAKISVAEIKAYARGMRNALAAVLERFECKDLALQTLIDGALGERRHRQEAGQTPDYDRRLFGNLAAEIRAHRVAMLDDAVTFDYPRWSAWQKRVWAIERQAVRREEWDEFERLQHELKALWSLSAWLIGCEHWRQKNWEWRKTQGVQVAKGITMTKKVYHLKR